MGSNSNRKVNIIIFGEAGAGKSSLVNLIAGKEVAQTSSGAMGCTFKSTPYQVKILDHYEVTLWDTAGLEEGVTGTVEAQTAINNIYLLTRQLKDGVSLLMYCVRGRITRNTIKNYKMFKAFCDDQVRMALIVTALEREPDKGLWWEQNMGAYSSAGININDHACVTTLPKEKDYLRSAKAVQDIIVHAHKYDPWKAESKGWAAKVIINLVSILFAQPSEGSKQLYEGLIRNGCSKSEAKNMVKEYKKLYRKNSKPAS